MPVGLPMFGANDIGPIDRQHDANLARIQAKYTNLAPVLEQLPAELTQQLVQVDSERVARGTPPLTDTQTAKALKSALDGKPFTPPAERGYGPRSLPGNVLNDLGSIVKSIPRIPQALVGEVRDLANFAEVVQQNEAEGMNPLAAFLNAPGVRMIPLTYVAGQAARGTEGLKELGRHPLFTALDVLPAAGKLAELTPVGRVAKEAELAAGRPAGSAALKALATRTLDDAGELVPNRLARGGQIVRDSTAVGRAIDEAFGKRARTVSRERDMLTARIQSVLGGMQAPADQLESAARDSVRLAEKYADWDPAKMADLTRRLELGDYAGLGAEELAFVSEVRDLNTRYADTLVSEGHSVRVNGEVYDLETGRRLERLQTRRARTEEMAFAREQVANPTLSPEEYLRAAYDWSTADMARGEKWLRVRSALEALDGLGLDVADLRKLENKVRRAGAWTDLQDALKAKLDAVQSGQQLPAMSQKQLDSGVRKLRRDRFMREQLAQFDSRAVRRVTKREQEALANAVPARFQPAVNAEAQARFTDLMQRKFTNTAEEAEQLAQAVAERRWRDVPGWDPEAERAYRGIQREVRQTWMEMRDAGLDPEFVHTVTPNKMAQAVFPTVTETRPGLSQAKGRTADSAPGTRDVSVALTHQGVEWLRRRGTEDLVDFVARKYGMSEADLREAYLPAARARAQMQPGLDVEGHLQRGISKEWVRFNPMTDVTWGSPKLQALSQEGVWLPKSVANSLKRMNDPRTPMAAVFDPVSKAFRMSVVGLSPRTQLYNLLGGATMTLARTGPSVLQYAEDAWKMVKDPSLIPDGELRAMMGAQARNLEGLADRALIREAAVPGEGALRFLQGRTLRRLWDESQKARASAAPFTEKVGWAANKSMEINAFVDNWYRAMTYLYGEGKARKLGVTDPEVARRAGLELARKTLADWSSMTPFERGVMRSIVPFYGFQQHAIRYVMSYPLDHPLRAEIMGKIGQAELDDLNDTLPTKFLGMFFPGGTNTNGKALGFNLAAVNPFGDVANMMTLAGFLGSTNPVIQTVLESVGVDFGTAELYPTLRFDPATGRLAGSRGNPLALLAENTIPQTQLLTSLAGANADFNERMRLDPAGAWRQLASAGGIPVVWRTYDLGAERIKSEVARQKSEREVLSDALRTGNWSEAERYPSLRAALEGVRQLPADSLPRFSKPADVASTLLGSTGGI